MAGLKPSPNLFALLDSDDPGDYRPTDFDAAMAKDKSKKQQQPAAMAKDMYKKQLASDLFGKAYPSAREIIFAQRRERAAKERALAESKEAGQNGAKQGGNHSNGEAKKQQPAVAVNEAPAPAPVRAPPPPPPSLDDMKQFPSLN